MSLVSYHKENRISSGLVWKLLTEYVPKELLRVPATQLEFGLLDFVQDDGHEFLQKAMSNSNHHLRMYGTAKELAENMKIYRNFTGFMEAMDADILEPYSMPPKIHKSFTDKEYIIKQDLFVHLQDLVLKHFPEMECIVMLSMILIFLRTKESQLGGCQQFVEYDKEEFAQLEAEVAALGKFMNKPGSLHFPMGLTYDLKVKNYTLSELLTQWKTILPFKLRNCQFDGIEAILQSVISEVPLPEQPLFFKHRFHNLNVIIKGLDMITDKRPLWFQGKEKHNTPKIIKVYEDYGESFVLIMDVLEAFIGKGRPDCIDKLEEFKTDDGADCLEGWQTISYDELRRRFPEECKRIEFIHTPVIRAKHRAVPIMDTNGDPSLFAADALLELLRRMIFSAKLFQRPNIDRVWVLLKLFLEDHHEFTTRHTIFILPLEDITGINDDFYMTFRQYMEEELDTVKRVRNAKKDGFTLDNLKNELKYLGLTNAFANITDFADIVYDHVFKNKKEDVLRTCDLFDALELCQLICISKKFPSIAEFLHSQKCCHRILVECDYCSREKVENAGKVPEDLKKKLSIAESSIVKLKKELKVAEEEEKTMNMEMEQKRTKKVEQLKLQIAEALQKAKDEADLFGKNLQLEKQLKKEHQVGESLQQEKKKQLEMKAAHLAEMEKVKERIKSETQNRSDDKELRKKNIRLKFQLNERKKTIENLLAELSL